MCPWWGGRELYDAVQRGDLDTPRTLYEQGTAEMRGCFRHTGRSGYNGI